MRAITSIIICFIFLCVSNIAHSADLLIQPPPPSMDKFYAKKGRTSEWIIQMEKISKTFNAVFISIDQKNWKEALQNASGFGTAYQKASKMVPEWKDLFDLKTSQNFITSIQSKDTEKIKQFSIKVKKTCSQCHQKHNISVWARYHWPSTQTIKILDPIEEQEVDYDEFMRRLAFSLKSIKILFEQGETNKSWKAIDIFSKQLRGLRSVCSKCHVTEWTKNSTTVKDFFVGEDMIDSLQEIKKTLASGTPDTKLFQKKIEYISKKSCKMCHLVHQPTAIIQRAWRD